MLKIIHYADIQAKVRLKNLTTNFKHSLNSIESIISETQADIVVIAGDIFEYEEPNEIERDLIFTHFINILSIPTLKELTFMLGNHDYDKDSISNKNPLSVFEKMGKMFLDGVDKSIINKLNYLQYTKETPSLVDNNLVWLPYSLEDGGVNQKNAYSDLKQDPDKMYISIFHDILLEYVEESGLPVRNKKRLFKRSDFVTKYIFAGDIHEIFEYDNFFYPGSTFQRNFGEGNYLKFLGTNKNKTLIAPNKIIKLHHVEVANKLITHSINQPINNNLHYITIDLSTKSNCDIEYIEKSIIALIDDKFNNSDLLFKLKISVDYQNIRKTLIKLLQTYTRFEVEIFDVATIDNQLVNTNVDIDNIENNNVVDTMSKEILIDLFDKSLNRINDGTDLFNKSKDEIINMFKSNLDMIFDADKSYKIELLNLATDGFQKLGPNVIDANFFGLSRIVGTNGYGKTQIYNMFYWLRYGIIYSGLKMNQKKYNNMLIFNNKIASKDSNYVIANYIINGNSVSIKRTVYRKWKNDTTDIQKLSRNKLDFISTTNQTLEITIFNADGTVKATVNDFDKCEKLLSNWFGNVVENLLIINYDKLKSLINLPSDKLEKLLLDYIGNDFIKSMINQFPDQKEKILDGMVRPKLTDTQINKRLSEINIESETLTSSIDNLNKIIVVDKSSLIDVKNNLTTLNSELTNIGNINNLIVNKNSQITESENYINNYVENKQKELPPKVTTIKPVLTSTLDVNVVNTAIDDYKGKLIIAETTLNNAINEYTNNQKLKLKALNNESMNMFVVTENNFNSKINDCQKLINESLYAKHLDLTLINVDKQIADINEYLSKINTAILDLKNNNVNLNTQINSGVCITCNTVLSGNSNVQIDKWKSEVSTNLLKIDKLIEVEKLKNDEKLKLTSFKTNLNLNIINGYVDTATNVDTFINKYNDYLNINEEIKLSANKCQQLAHKYVELQDEYDEYSRLTFDEKFNKLDDTFKSTYNELNNSITTIDKSLNIFSNELSMCNELQLNIDKLQNAVDNHNNIVTKHNTLLTEYNNEIDTYNTTVNEVQQYNQKLIELSRDYENYKSSLIQLKDELNTLTVDKLPKYNLLLENETKLQTKISNLELSIENVNKQINDKNIELVRYTTEIETLNENLIDFNKYNDKKYVIKYYSLMINTIFPKAVFNYYRASINFKFNELLQNINFGLNWSSDGNLYKIEYVSDGKQIHTPVIGASGMETIFLGLAFVYSVTELNHKHKFSHIFIDELTGQLNKGKSGNKDMNTNYQELFLMLLNKFDNSKIFIVDHVIKNMFETKTLTLTHENNITTVNDGIN